ncbi:unnamed protein product [Scytosiphon promiscuus]
MSFSGRRRCQAWRLLLLPAELRRRVLLLFFFGTVADVKHCRGVMALTTVLDPLGFPLLLGASQGVEATSEDKSPGKLGGGRLQRIELVYLVRAIENHLYTHRGSTFTSFLPEDLLPLLTASATEPLAENRMKRDDDKGIATSPSARAPPLLMLNGHACALSLPPDIPGSEQLGEKRGEYRELWLTLLEPYAWESDQEAPGFMFPRWMWDVVDGDAGGGSFLMAVAPIANLTTAPLPRSSTERWRDGTCKPTRTRDKGSKDGSKAAKLHECFEPFVQLASWGHGRFDTLAQFTPDGLHLGVGGVVSGGEGWGGWSPPPAAPGSTSEDWGRSGRDGVHAILTREGSLDVVAAGDLHLRSGKAQRSVAGGKPEKGDLQTAASGEYGAIRLGSDSLEWSSRPPSLPSSTSPREASENSPEGSTLFSPHFRNGSLFFRVDANNMEASGFSEGVGLSAARSFGLEVVGSDSVTSSDGGEESKDGRGEGNAGVKHAKGKSEGLAQGLGSSLIASGSGRAMLRGNTESMNASAGSVNVKAAEEVLVSGGNRATLTSSSGDVILDTTGANGSVVLAGGGSILGVSPVVYFAAGPVPVPDALAGEGNNGPVQVWGGGHLNLTRGSATIGVSSAGEHAGASLQADHEVRVSAGNSSLFRVSESETVLETSVIVFRSSPSSSLPASAPGTAGGRVASTPPLEDARPTALPRHQPPPPSPVAATKREIEPGLAAEWAEGAFSELSMDGGILEVAASASIGLQSAGAAVRLFGRSNTSRGDSNGEDDGGRGGTAAELVVDADAVRIRARAASAGVSISADGAPSSAVGSATPSAEGWRDDGGGRARNGTTAGGHLEVSAGGITMQGMSTNLTASRSISLRVESPTKGEGSRIDEDRLKASEGKNEEPSSSVELNDWGLRVNIGGSSQKFSWDPYFPNHKPQSHSNGTIFLRAGSRVVLVAPQLSISHDGGAGIGVEEEGDVLSRRFAAGAGASGSTNGRDRQNGGRRGGGLWSDGTIMTGRAEQRVLLQAGLTRPPADYGPTVSEADSGSHIAIQRSWIHVCAGRSSGNVSPLAPFPGTDAAATATRETAAKTSGGGGSGMGDDTVGRGLPRKGLLVEVAGEADLVSTEDVRLRAGGGIAFSSSNKTSLHSLHGVFLSTSRSTGGGVDGGTAVSKNDGFARPTGSADKRRQMQEKEQKQGHIILAPREGSGVAIGPGFTAQDLERAAGVESRNACSPRPTPSSSLNPRVGAPAFQSCRHVGGGSSAVRFGCEGLPYSGGLEVRHDRDKRAADSIVLELASTPGRIVGDARGRWGVGAVPVEESGESRPQLAAALHVFAPAEAETSAVLHGAEMPPPALVVESAVDSAGVVQLLHKPSVNPAWSRQRTLRWACVLPFVHPPGATQRDDTYSHWVLSQLAGGRSDEGRRRTAVSAAEPPWADPRAASSSWIGGMALSHVVAGGGPSSWRTAFGTTQPPSSPSPSARGAGDGAGAAGDSARETARPAVAFGVDGRSGFGTAPTGARVTVGGALLAEQMLILSDEGLVRDVESLGAQGRSIAMDTVRAVDVVSFGWTKEASRSYGIDLDARQLGVIAQKVDEKKTSASLVWTDADSGRKAVSYSRLVVTIAAALQHLDDLVQTEGVIRDTRLEQLERASASVEERTGHISDRLEAVEGMAKTGLESLLTQARGISTLEGRVTEQAGQAEILSTGLARAQENASLERGESQAREWRKERSLREQELSREVLELKARIAELKDEQKVSKENHQDREKAQDDQIRALSLRIGAVHASQSSDCDSSMMAELESLRASHGDLEDRVADLAEQARQHPALNEEASRAPSSSLALFSDEVRRLEGNLRAGLRDATGYAAQDGPGAARFGEGLAVGSSAHKANPASEAEVREHLERHKESVRLEAMASVLRHREHLKVLRQEEAWLK